MIHLGLISNDGVSEPRISTETRTPYFEPKLLKILKIIGALSFRSAPIGTHALSIILKRNQQYTQWAGRAQVRRFFTVKPAQIAGAR